jgi:hypothetical protein
LGIKNGGANQSSKGADLMIILPITQIQLFLSMLVAEVLLLSDPNYTVRIGSENYFSLAVGAFVGGIFIFAILAIRFGHGIAFKDYKPKVPMLVKVNQKQIK